MGVNRDDAARASYQADPGDDVIGVSAGRGVVSDLRGAAYKPGNSRYEYASKRTGTADVRTGETRA